MTTPASPQWASVRKSLGLGVGTLCIVGLALAQAAAPALAAPPFKYEEGLSKRLSETVPGESFSQPWTLTFDGAGNLYVADPGNPAGGVIDKFDQSDTFIEPQLGPGVLSANFTFGVAVNDETGHIYVADSDFSEVFVMDGAGGKLSQWTGSGTPSKSFGGGCCFVFDAVDNSTSVSKGEIYVMSQHEGGEVDVFKSQGEDKEEGEYLRSLSPPAGGFKFGGNDGLAVNDSSGPEAGQVYVVDSGNRVVDRYSAEGSLEEAHQLTGPSPSEPFKEPVAVALDSASGDVFVVDLGARVVDEFSPAGELINQIKQAAGQPFLEPVGVAVQRAGENQGDVYVADAARKAIDVFALEVPGPPSIPAEGVSEVSAESATLDAEINPHGAISKYRFEYGPCASPQTCPSSPYTPTAEAAVGAEDDFSAHAVSLHIQGLSPSSAYHFRAVAHNSHGEVTGEERIFTTQGPGGELTLPDARAWELVSPPDKHGAVIEPVGRSGVIEASASGDALGYLANAPTEASPPGDAGRVQVLSRRGGAG